MTDQERIELREWSARLVGLVIGNPDAPLWLQRFTNGDLVDDWRPDLPTSPASQILSVVEKLEEDGAEINIQKGQTQVFYRGLWHSHTGEGRLLNTLKAMYKAVKATGEGETK